MAGQVRPKSSAYNPKLLGSGLLPQYGQALASFFTASLQWWHVLVGGFISDMGERYTKRETAVNVAAIAISTGALLWALYQVPSWGDFTSVYYPILFLDNPYAHVGFLNPPWVLPVLHPLASLSSHAAGAVWVLFSVLSVVYCAGRLEADRLAYLLIFTNPAFIRFMTSGQIDALALWGMVITHPALSVLLLTIKPQVAGTAVLFRLQQMTKWQAVAIAAVVIGSLLWLGNWPAMLWHNWQNGVNHAVSMDIFPYGVPFGLLLLAWSIKHEKSVMGALSCYFLAPYVSPSSVFVYTVLIFSTFSTFPRLIVFALLWIVALVLT